MRPAGKCRVDTVAAVESRQNGDGLGDRPAGEGSVQRGEGQAAAQGELEVAGVLDGQTMAFSQHGRR